MPYLQALVAFSHHVPGHMAHDLAFFDKATALYGLSCTVLQTVSMPHIFNGKPQEVMLYSVTR